MSHSGKSEDVPEEGAPPHGMGAPPYEPAKNSPKMNEIESTIHRSPTTSQNFGQKVQKQPLMRLYREPSNVHADK